MRNLEPIEDEITTAPSDENVTSSENLEPAEANENMLDQGTPPQPPKPR